MVILNYSRRSITFLKPLTNYLRFFGILPDYDFETKTLTNSLIYPISSCVTFVAIVFLVTVDLSAILANVAAFGIEIFQVCEILTHFFGVACLFWCRYDCHVKRKVWEHFLRSMAKIESKEYLNADDTEQNFCLNPFVQFVSLNVLLLGGYVARFAVDDYYNDIGFLGYLPLMIFSFENMLVSFVISSLAISFKNKLERINELLQNCVGRESLEVDEVRKAKSLYLAVNKLVDEYNNLFGKQLLFMPLLCLCKVLTVTLVVCFRGRLIRFASNILHILFAIFMMMMQSVLMYCCDTASRESQNILATCHAIQDQFLIYSIQHEVLEDLAVKVLTRPVKFSAMNYFEINRSTMFALISNTVMYFIAFVQFSNT
ncbi:uncharacterized protein LOC132699008 [Cylas formicarius]|uniref:uncharacterized protein LOC132699008 n=1 Tax=Cylas formicarius TaxID=197179 RepID=UPI0029586D77|nr:uncharacterized protein LOC132699008 [Cylas formicarius]